MPQLLAIAEYITKTHASAWSAGTRQSHAGLVASEDPVLRGAHGMYAARLSPLFRIPLCERAARGSGGKQPHRRFRTLLTRRVYSPPLRLTIGS